MRAIYEAYDGTKFDRLNEVFNYEWRELFPNIRIFAHDGRAVNSVDEEDYYLIYKVNNKDEKAFIINYLIEMYGGIAFWDMFQNETASETGYFIDADDDIRYTTEDAVAAYFEDSLDPTSPLVCELEIGEKA